jgi:hypothetical protein
MLSTAPLEIFLDEFHGTDRGRFLMSAHKRQAKTAKYASPTSPLIALILLILLRILINLIDLRTLLIFSRYALCINQPKKKKAEDIVRKTLSLSSIYVFPSLFRTHNASFFACFFRTECRACLCMCLCLRCVCTSPKTRMQRTSYAHFIARSLCCVCFALYVCRVHAQTIV